MCARRSRSTASRSRGICTFISLGFNGHSLRLGDVVWEAEQSLEMRLLDGFLLSAASFRSGGKSQSFLTRESTLNATVGPAGARAFECLSAERDHEDFHSVEIRKSGFGEKLCATIGGIYVQ